MPFPLLRCASLTIAALLITLSSVGGTLPAQASAAPSARVAADGPPMLWDAVADLPVAVEDRTGYQRSSFKHWVDADHDGCSTRAEALIEEAVEAPTIGAGCSLTGGSWYSYYDDTTVQDAARLDVDHLVPLAEAWDSGADEWTAQRREEYANFLGEPYHLVAVTARSNRQKADKDPSQWLPPYAPARCRYVGEWVAVKRRWVLAVDVQEKQALTTIASGCPNVALPGAGA